MDNLGMELLDFLATAPLTEARHDLYKLLNAGEDEINVYYLVHLSNFKSIIADGGIKCKAIAGTDIIDLSGHNVQAMRDKTIRLGQKIISHEEINIDKKIHQCINFFWNPLNDTFLAFQRNSLLKNPQNNTYGIVCILEMKLSAFFESDKVYWSTSVYNLALSIVSGFSKEDYKKFNWNDIFSLHGDKSSNKFRSAEFIAFYSNPMPPNSDLIPIQFIRRILVPPHYETMIKEILPSVQTKIYSAADKNIFHSKEKLLNAEKQMIITLYNLHRLNLLHVDDFCELINTFSKLDEQLGCSLIEDFFGCKDMAHSKHGIGHVTRVMFWVHTLCFLSHTNQKIEEAILYAAFIHDLCRKDNRLEKEHGFDAAKKYEDFLIQKQIPDNLIHGCMNAVIYHCKDDNECSDKDLIWKALKDADSLDRGRFGPPIGYRTKRQDSKGCKINSLRLDILRDSPLLTEKLAWMAFWLASITSFTGWKRDTFMDFKNEIVVSLKASLRNGILNIEEHQIADKMLRYLSAG